MNEASSRSTKTALCVNMNTFKFHLKYNDIHHLLWIIFDMAGDSIIIKILTTLAQKTFTMKTTLTSWGKIVII